MCATVTSSRNTDNFTCLKDRDFLHNISDLMLSGTREYEALSKPVRYLLKLKQHV